MSTIPTTHMRERLAGQMVIDELLREQALTRPRSSVSKLLGRTPLSDESRPWYLGALGEIAVGRMLEQLPPEWSSFHAVPVGTKQSDIDHILVGPGGVFTINTKHHSGKNIWIAERTLMVNGHKQPYLRNSEHEADRVVKILRERMPQLMMVHPVIVLVDPKQITVKKRPARVRVLDSRQLRRWLQKQPVALTPTEVHELVTVIDDPATWRATDASDSAGARLQFELLDAEVRTARIRRVLWSVGGMAVIGLGAFVVYPALFRVLLGL